MRISRTASVLTAAFLGGEKSDEKYFAEITLKYYQHNKKLTLQAKPKRSNQQMHRQALTSVELQG